MDDDKRNLRELRRVIEAAPAERLYMGDFSKSESPSCGTAYCAAGWFAIDPWAVRNTRIGDILSVDEDGYIDPLVGYETPVHLAGIFGISDDDASVLFGIDYTYDPFYGPIKDQVLNNIDKLIAGGKLLPR